MPSALKLLDNTLLVVFFCFVFFTVDSFSYFLSLLVKQIATAGSKKEEKGAEKLTFSLNEGGIGHREAAVTMQGRLRFFSLSLLSAKTRFMTSQTPPYFSN